MNQKSMRWGVCLPLVGALVACDVQSATPVDTTAAELAKIPASTWQALSQRSLFFGHQSVGANMIDGLQALEREYPQLTWRVQDLPAGVAWSGPVFAHHKIGINEQPFTKNDAFAAWLSAAPTPVDMAAVKYCFLDIRRDTDVDDVFSHYQQRMAALRARYPRTRFVHFTVPLTVVQTGPKAYLKRILGKPIGGYADNAKRHRYNELIRTTYSGKEPVFDIARLQSTHADGSRETFEFDGQTHEALAPEYASDGAHLNAAGQRYIAGQFLIFLAHLTSSGSS